MDAIKMQIPARQKTEIRIEKIKNQFLVCLYEKDWAGAKNQFSGLHDLVARHTRHPDPKDHPPPPLSENSEKLINQALRVYQKFKSNNPEPFAPVFALVYKKLKKEILGLVRQAGTPVLYVSFNTWEHCLGLSLRQKELLYRTAMTFQLTSGCSNFCRRCNEWALPKVRAHFDFKAIKNILGCLAKQGNSHISLYGASDPLDWSQGDNSIADIIRDADTAGLEYSLLTKAPKSRTTLLKTLVTSGANISVSMTSRNKARIKRIEQELPLPISKQHDTDDLLIPACLDEDFISVKPSITDGYGTEITPDGAYIIIPTFTSALHPFGHKKRPITAETPFFPVKKTGRHALLVDYFKPLEVYDLNLNRLHLDRLIDVQIESILLDNGHYDLTPPGMRSTKEYFSIFETKARIQRKKMTVSILKKLKKRYLENASFKLLGLDDKKEYRKKIDAHFDLCKKDNCLLAQKNTAAFFLSHIRDYKKNNPTKIKIIRYLLKNEIQAQQKMTKNCDHSISHFFMDEKTDAFALFRTLALEMTATLDTLPAIDRFIDENSVIYDPTADIFTSPPSGTAR